MQTLSELGEFGLIERISRLAGRRRWPQVVIGIGDDAAVLRPRTGEDWVVSTDASVEDVHFRWSTASPRVIGRRALVANLSDLAAMGARPLGFTLALQAPPRLAVRTFEGVLAGMLDEAGRHECPLVGGNVTRARQTSLAITVMGAVKRGRALRRDVLEPGDQLFVTGVLGASALALARAEQRGAKLRHVPTPRLVAGRALGRLRGCGACIDVSDGLVADLGHLLEASGVGAEIDPSLLPRPRGFDRACRAMGKDPETLLLHGGEDYELLFSLRAGLATPLSKSVLERRLGARVTEFGRVEAAPGLRGAGSDGGWRHF
jgi:thiamine-monophosphate kinase